MADPRQHGYLCRPQQAASVSARMAFSRGVDHSVCPDGSCVLSGPQIWKATAKGQPGPAAVWDPVGCELLLVCFLFQSVSLLVFFYLAHPSVDSDPGYHDTIPQALTAGWYADASISAVGRLRRISEPGNLSAELKHLPNRDLVKHHLQPFGAWR